MTAAPSKRVGRQSTLTHSLLHGQAPTSTRLWFLDTFTVTGSIPGPPPLGDKRKHWCHLSGPPEVLFPVHVAMGHQYSGDE